MPTIAAPAEIQDAVAAHHADLAADVTAMPDRARLPVEVDADSHPRFRTTIMISANLRAKPMRMRKTNPYLRGGDVIHQFFKEMIDRLEKTSRPSSISGSRFIDGRRAAEGTPAPGAGSRRGR